MTIDEAIKILSRTGKDFLNSDPNDIDEAEKLSVEALKVILLCRHDPKSIATILLRGETKK